MDDTVAALLQALEAANAAREASDARASVDRAARDASDARASVARAAREASDAALSVARAAREASDAALSAALAHLRLAAPRAAEVAAAAGLGVAVTPTIRSHLSLTPNRALGSPSGSDPSIIDSVFCAVVERPVAAAALGIALVPGVAAAFRALLDAAAGDASALAPEANFYARATARLPAFAEAVGDASGNMDASALFTPRSLSTRAWSFARRCVPELRVRAAVSAARAFRPAFNGEVKSIGPTWLGQAVYYTAMDMVRVFFPALANGAAPGPRRFFSRPPVGFALVTFPHVGYFVSLEWVGVLFCAPVSAPFFVGSAEHAAAAAALPDVSYDEPEPLNEHLDWRTCREGARRPEAVSWVIEDGVFRKLLCADARSPARFRALYDAYARLAALHADAAATAPPALAVIKSGVRLLYGAHEVLVQMDALAGARDATNNEVTTAGPVLEGAAAAIAWLAARGILYVDLRGPNVLIEGVNMWLIDFDDCVVVDAPVRDALAFRCALVECGANVEGWASALTRDALPEVDAALARAFAALPSAA